jgi:hypothetical protein
MAWRYRPTHSLYQYEMKASDTFQDQAAWPNAQRYLVEAGCIIYSVWAIWRKVSFRACNRDIYICGGDWACKFPKITSGSYLLKRGKWREISFLSNAPPYPKEHCVFFKVSRLRCLALLIEVGFSWR